MDFFILFNFSSSNMEAFLEYGLKNWLDGNLNGRSFMQFSNPYVLGPVRLIYESISRNILSIFDVCVVSQVL